MSSLIFIFAKRKYHSKEVFAYSEFMIQKSSFPFIFYKEGFRISCVACEMLENPC